MSKAIEQKRAEQRERSIQRRMNDEGMTREAAEIEQAKADARSAKFLEAVAAAKLDAHEKGYIKGHGGQSSVACPVCADGTIRYSVASLNGHMMAACTTQYCVSWME